MQVCLVNISAVQIEKEPETQSTPFECFFKCSEVLIHLTIIIKKDVAIQSVLGYHVKNYING